LNDSPVTHPKRPTRFARGLRVLAIVIVVAFVIFWFARGGRTGWSQDRVPVKQVDELTGLESITYENRYVPGADFLAIGIGISVTLLAVSFLPLFRKNIPPTL
jgi:hypothetical protein